MDLVWLDVLCLRQEGVLEREAVRVEEWKIDVPTIGTVYAMNAINGMESYQSMNVGGLAKDSPFPPRIDSEGRLIEDRQDVQRFYARLEIATNNSVSSGNALSAVAAMSERHAFHVVDKIGGVTQMLNRGRMPVYVRNDTPSVGEDAWLRLVDAMNDTFSTHFFFLFPRRGDGKYSWCPSWSQLNERIPRVSDVRLYEESCRTDKMAPFRYEGYTLQGCLVRGLAEADTSGYCRSGTVVITCTGAVYSFEVQAHHQEPIPEDLYALVGNMGGSPGMADSGMTYWVLGHVTSSGKFEKFSVVRMEAKDRSRLKKLNLSSKKIIDLV
ncbi:hypothetical protein EIP86_009442 [Pleurotus ostreatoroseus]|nr:hypothetical protein EIP86_009442 [Pleurotus ostreatoroseus]